MTDDAMNSNSFTSKYVTTEWVCDKCGQTVSIENGVIGWKFSIDKNQIPHLVVPLGIYHKCCSPHFSRSNLMEQPYIDMAAACCGPDGLSLLLDYAEQIPLLRDDFLKIVRRIFIPRFERLNKYADIALKNGLITPNNVVITPFQYDFDELEKDLEAHPERYK